MPEILGRVLGVESQVFWWLLPLFKCVFFKCMLCVCEFVWPLNLVYMWCIFMQIVLASFVSDGKQSKSAKRMRNVSAPAAAKAAHRQGALLVSLQVGSGVGAH